MNVWLYSLEEIFKIKIIILDTEQFLTKILQTEDVVIFDDYDDVNLFMSPSATAFYTKPFKVGKRLILSPELYVISTPLIYSSVDKVSVSDRTFSAFIGTGVDYQISKRFKVNMNYKLNMSTNPEFPILSFFLIGSKINL